MKINVNVFDKIADELAALEEDKIVTAGEKLKILEFMKSSKDQKQFINSIVKALWERESKEREPEKIKVEMQD